MMINYVNVNSKHFVNRNNGFNKKVLSLEYNTVEELEFVFIDDNNRIIELSQLSGLALAVGLKQAKPSYDLLALSKDYTIEDNTIKFQLNCYTVNWLQEVKKNNTEAYIELSQQSLTQKRVMLRDYCYVFPRTYVEGLTPEEISSADYYTKEEVDELLDGIEIPTKLSELENDEGFVDASYVDTALLEKQDLITSENKLAYELLSGTPSIPTAVSELTNDSGYQTAADVEAAISGKADTSALTAHTSDTVIHVTAEDKTNWNAKLDASALEGYATEQYVETSISGKADKDEIPTAVSELTNDSGYQTAADVEAAISGKQDKITAESKLAYELLSGTPTIPTKVSELQNDTGFITDAALSGKQDVITSENKLAYELLSGTPSIPTDTSELTNGAGFITDAALSSKQDRITKYAKLSYTLLSGTPTIPLSTSQLTNDSGFITDAALNGYATETYVGNALSSKQDNITKYAKLGTSLISGVYPSSVYVTQSNSSLSSGTYPVYFAGGQALPIQRFSHSAAASGSITFSYSKLEDVGGAHIATVEVQVPITGDVSTITFPSGTEVISVPETLEATSGMYTYYDIVFRAQKNSSGTRIVYVNYAYKFDEE